MKFLSVSAVGLALLGAPAFADGHASGDAASGEKIFGKCKSCHMVVDDAGEAIEKGGKTGPNLYGIYERVAGSVADYNYGNSLQEAGEKGLEWDEETFTAYVADPKGFLREYLDDNKAKSRMSFRLRKEQDAADVWAYLVSVGPEVEDDAEVEVSN